METTKPIKRNAVIAEFSKDHHFALILIWKIREGFKKFIEPARINKYAIHFFESDLIHHFKEEEALLFSKLDTNNSLRIQAESEHKIIYRMIEDLRSKTDDKDLLQRFADTLEKHIRFEERELFNYMQHNFTENVLSEIASSLKPRAHEPETKWTDTFWDIKTTNL